MAISSFGKNFSVKGKRNINKFTKEMLRESNSKTKIKNNFKSQYTRKGEILNKIKNILT